MTSCPERDRLRELLTDTITLLCKNGLQYKNVLSVEALIGVTLDSQDVFLVNIKEIVQSVLTDSADVISGEDTESDSNDNARSMRKRKSTSVAINDNASQKHRRLGNDTDELTCDDVDDGVSHDDADVKAQDGSIQVKAEPYSAGHGSEPRVQPLNGVAVSEAELKAGESFTSGAVGSSATPTDPYPQVSLALLSRPQDNLTTCT